LEVYAGRPSPRLYDRVVETPRTRHYSRRTGEACVHWIRRFLVFHNRTQPRELAAGDVNLFVTHLTGVGHASACHVLERPLDRVEGAVRARKPKRLPAGLRREEVAAVLAHLEGVPRLVCTLLSGSGLRLLEALHEPLEDHLHAWVEPWRAGVHSPLDRLRQPASVETGGITLTGRSASNPGRRVAQRGASGYKPVSCGQSPRAGEFVLS
jgi:hypothetical protein